MSSIKATIFVVELEQIRKGSSLKLLTCLLALLLGCSGQSILFFEVPSTGGGSTESDAGAGGGMAQSGGSAGGGFGGGVESGGGNVVDAGVWHWTQVLGPTTPLARDESGAAFDTARGKFVIFGGSLQFANGTGYLPETWELTPFDDGGFNWRQLNVSSPIGRQAHALVYDSDLKRIVLFGGSNGVEQNDTWSFGPTSDGGLEWTLLSDAGPQPRYVHSMSYDSARKKIVLFGGVTTRQRTQDGGFGLGFFQDTWEFGADSGWVQMDGGSTIPSARYGGAMASDNAGRTILIGGAPKEPNTWVWDGILWRSLDSGVLPLRSGANMVFDTTRNKFVMFGGSGVSTMLNDLYQLNQNTWEPIDAGTVVPLGRYNASVAFDPLHNQMIVFGGRRFSDGTNVALPFLGTKSTWLLRGNSWTQLTYDEPLARYGHAMAYDSIRKKVVLFGGYNSVYGYFSDTWEFSNGHWIQLDNDRLCLPLGKCPSPRWLHGMTFDSEKTVLFGGSYNNRETWIFEGNSWKQKNVNGPTNRSTALAFDSVRKKVVMFGGFGPTNVEVFQDTWEWDPAMNTWDAVDAGTVLPSPRGHHVIAYDSTNNRTVLFGGGPLPFSDTPQSDTWSFSANSWRFFTRSGPSGRVRPSMAFDQIRGKMVLFGGFGSASYFGDTFELTGNTWSSLTLSTSPSARWSSAMVYDSQRGVMVLFGGNNDNNAAATKNLSDTWEYGP
jgi:N-acetylneuraminic acid mutarotase